VSEDREKYGAKNDGGPAFPVPDSHDANGQVQYGANGMSLRQYAAIHLRVPDSGNDWLDDMIRKSNEKNKTSVDCKLTR
jgi:hypothetical protein